MSSPAIFSFDDYKAFLNELIGTQQNKGRGVRQKLAELLEVKSSYISQVLNGFLQFSPEQALQIADYFALSKKEQHFFLLLIQKERAGTLKLKQFYESQIHDQRIGSKQLAQRFGSKRELTTEEMQIYYSQWYFAALHILVSIPAYNHFPALLKVTALSEKTLKESLHFLISTGLVLEKNGKYSMGESRLHLGGHSAMISKHHTNWRIQVLKSLENPLKEDIHYSSIVSISRSDAFKLREEFLAMLEKYNRVVAKSPEEECHCLAFDFFQVDR